ncbi:MAG TPA: DUF2889 domain-containing protein [Acidimicrobiales bacterium]|nr:DUF2889 domain-containing protein [Acidimicrobiales bacterium]
MSGSGGWWAPAVSTPLDATPARRPGSLRRTMHVDVGVRSSWADPLPMSGAARDIRSGDGDPDEVTVLAEAALTASFDVGRRLVEVETTPPATWATELVGARAGGGFRRRIDDVMPPEEAGSLLRLVLDDLPAGALISGYALLRLARRAGHDPATLTPADALARMTDICSGWRAGGAAATGVAAGRGVPIQDCPPAPDLVAGDPAGWHAMEPLPPDGMRRRRCLDVWLEDAEDPAGRFAVWAMFRDTVGEPGGGEAVLHEYQVEVEGEGDVVRAVRADPRVLPFPECPGAAAEVHRLAGVPLAAFSDSVPEILVGTLCCTHLNDLLRALGGAAGLFELARRN